MNKVDLYASFISDQVALDEVFGGRDRGYPYDKGEDEINPKTDHHYHIHMGTVHPAILSVMHDVVDDADVSFYTAKDPSKVYHHANDNKVETKRREMTPEEKTTYTNAYRDSMKKDPTEYPPTWHHSVANRALYLKHNISIPDPIYDTKQTPALAKHATRLFSTIGGILKDHSKKYKVNNYQFAGEGDSRKSLYNRIASRFGGKRTGDSPSDDLGKSYSHYSIPADLKKEK